MMKVMLPNDPFIEKVIIPTVKSYATGRERIKLDIIPIFTKIDNVIGNRNRNGKDTITNNKMILVPNPQSFNSDFLGKGSIVNKHANYRLCDDYYLFIDTSYYDNIITPHMNKPEECINMQNELTTQISRQMVYTEKFKLNIQSLKNDFDMLFNMRESFKIGVRLKNDNSILMHMVYVTYLVGCVNLQISTNNQYLSAKDDYSKLKGIVANMSFYNVEGYLSIMKSIMQESDRNTGFDLSKLMFLTYMRLSNINNPARYTDNATSYNRGDTTIMIEDMLSIYIKDLYSSSDLKDILSLDPEDNYDIEVLTKYIRTRTLPASELKDRYCLEAMTFVLFESAKEFFARKSDLPSDVINAMKEYDMILATIHAMRTGRNAKYMVDELYDIIHKIADLKLKYIEDHNILDELDALDDNISATITKMNNRSYDTKIDMSALGIPEGYRD